MTNWHIALIAIGFIAIGIYGFICYFIDLYEMASERSTAEIEDRLNGG